MVHFIIGAVVPRPLLVAAREMAGAGTNTSANLYFFYDYINLGYFGSCTAPSSLPPTTTTTRTLRDQENFVPFDVCGRRQILYHFYLCTIYFDPTFRHQVSKHYALSNHEVTFFPN
jgi:hypothetical protein